MKNIGIDQFVQILAEFDEGQINSDFLIQKKRQFARENKLVALPSNIELLATYRKLIAEGKITKNLNIERVFMKRPIRSLSGIVSVQVLTKPFWCPGKCIFCPNDFTMPKSYINTEPGAMRALMNGFDPIKQVLNRLVSLKSTGHLTDKIEMIVLGGTWDVYPESYKHDFVKGVYDACSYFDEFFGSLSADEISTKAAKSMIHDLKVPHSENIEQAIELNSKCKSRIIGLTVETRPEYVTEENCRFWRRLGVTRIEMGIQSLFDEVLDANKRGHSVEQARQAMHNLRSRGFKVSVHVMPGLYMSNLQKDIETFRRLYSDEFFKPDEIKFYPTSVIPNTELYELYLAGHYIPLKTDEIKQIIEKTFIEIIPPYTRIKRLIRDIPSTEIVAGSNITNLSQMVHDDLKKTMSKSDRDNYLLNRLFQNTKFFPTEDQFLSRVSDFNVDEIQDGETVTGILSEPQDLKIANDIISLDTRSREIRNKKIKQTKTESSETIPFLMVRVYKSSIGMEFFVSVEDNEGFLYGLARLLLPNEKTLPNEPGLGEKTALIRELHVYGKVAGIKQVGGDTQHRGVGRQLMDFAEKISSVKGFDRLSVISGTGVREYYAGLGYELDGTYMVKPLRPSDTSPQNIGEAD